MAFVPLTSAEISAGEPTKQELFTKIKDNEIDLDSRTTTVEGAINAFLPIDFTLNGDYSQWGTITGANYERLTFNLTVTGARLLIVDVGTSGSTEVDILFDRGSGFGGNSIFTTRPSVAFGAGSLALSSNAVLDGTKKLLQAGDLLRFDLTASQTAGKNLILFLEYDKT